MPLRSSIDGYVRDGPQFHDRGSLLLDGRRRLSWSAPHTPATNTPARSDTAPLEISTSSRRAPHSAVPCSYAVHVPSGKNRPPIAAAIRTVVNVRHFAASVRPDWVTTGSGVAATGMRGSIRGPLLSGLGEALPRGPSHAVERRLVALCTSGRPAWRIGACRRDDLLLA
jgi:hypothetical protein